MNIEEFLIEARVKIARKRKKKDALEEILLKSTKPEKIVDHLSPYELQELSKDVLKRKVDDGTFRFRDASGNENISIHFNIRNAMLVILN